MHPFMPFSDSATPTRRTVLTPDMRLEADADVTYPLTLDSAFTLITDGCPVTATLNNGSTLFGFAKRDGAYIASLAGFPIFLQDCYTVRPSFLHHVDRTFEEISTDPTFEIEATDVATVSNDRGVWVVSRAFAEAYVDTWVK